MLRKSTDTFSFEIPDGWRAFAESGRLTANGPGGEVLILSSWAAPADLLDAVEQNAKRAATSAASDPALTITKALAEGKPAGGIHRCWTVLAEDGAVFFGQAIIRGRSAVMLATYEAPLSQKAAESFSEFLDSFYAD